MKNYNEEIDQVIKDTLTKEEAKFYDELDEQGLMQMIGGLFHTRHRWLIVLMNIVTFIMIGLFIYCAIQFLNAENTNDLIKWGAAGAICWSFVAMIKLFVWMQMDKNALLREMKRLELQVAALSGKSNE